MNTLSLTIEDEESEATLTVRSMEGGGVAVISEGFADEYGNGGIGLSIELSFDETALLFAHLETILETQASEGDNELGVVFEPDFGPASESMLQGGIS
jgi:hypothetical protein